MSGLNQISQVAEAIMTNKGACCSDGTNAAPGISSLSACSIRDIPELEALGSMTQVPFVHQNLGQVTSPLWASVFSPVNMHDDLCPANFLGNIKLN